MGKIRNFSKLILGCCLQFCSELAPSVFTFSVLLCMTRLVLLWSKILQYHVLESRVSFAMQIFVDGNIFIVFTQLVWQHSNLKPESQSKNHSFSQFSLGKRGRDLRTYLVNLHYTAVGYLFTLVIVKN